MTIHVTMTHIVVLVLFLIVAFSLFAKAIERLLSGTMLLVIVVNPNLE